MGTVWTQYLLYRNPESTHLIVRWSHYIFRYRTRIRLRKPLKGDHANGEGSRDLITLFIIIFSQSTLV